MSRNPELEQLLGELNAMLRPLDDRMAACAAETLPKIFLFGPMRSGTTLFMQWLATTGLVAYPTNLLSRFFEAPLVGAKIQKLLTDPRYNFRNEILDFNAPVTFHSENGKTTGALAPNEFWYFWRHHLGDTDFEAVSSEELLESVDLAGLRDDLNALSNEFEKPFAIKAMILNQHIPVLQSLFGNAIYVWVRRDPIHNMHSTLRARLRQYGTIEEWYSFKVREYAALKSLDPLHAVAGQIIAMNRSVEQAFGSLPAADTLVVRYEDFCDAPESCYQALKERLRSHDGLVHDLPYSGEEAFRKSNTWSIEEYSEDEARHAYSVMHARMAGA